MATEGVRRAQRTVGEQVFDRAAWTRVARNLAAAATQALHESAADPRSHLAAGDRALARDDYPAAAACFRRALGLAPADLDALQGLAVALVAERRFEEAVSVYRRIIDVLPQDGPDAREARLTTLYNLAVGLSRLGSFSEAEQTYRDLLAADGENVRARHNLATLYQAQGKLSAARDEWEKVVALAPRLASARTSLGETLLDLGRSEEAMRQFAEATHLSPDDPAAHLRFAESALACGSLGRAVVATKRAAKLSPEDPAVWAGLGRALLEVHRLTGKPDALAEAVAAWRRSLELDGRQDDVRRLIETYTPATAPAERDGA